MAFDGCGMVSCSKYHATLFKVPRRPLWSTTPPSLKYPITLFKVPRHPLQSTTPPSSKYNATLFEVPHHPLQSTTPPSSKYIMLSSYTAVAFGLRGMIFGHGLELQVKQCMRRLRQLVALAVPLTLNLVGLSRGAIGICLVPYIPLWHPSSKYHQHWIWCVSVNIGKHFNFEYLNFGIFEYMVLVNNLEYLNFGSLKYMSIDISFLI